jgi:tetratricopeptide (TPR) repeat protein
METGPEVLNESRDPVRRASWEKSRHVLVAVIFAATVITAYSHTLKTPFVFDDLPNIVRNGYLRIQDLSWNSIAYVWQSPHPLKNRKLAYLSFAVSYVGGGYNPLGYHLFNMAIHVGCGLLAALFFSQTLRTGWLGTRYGPVRSWLAWGAAFFWALHPIQINAVTYIVQRMTSLSVFFALLSMVTWMAGRSCWERRLVTRALLYWSSGVLAWILGMQCKEHVGIVPLLILAHEYFLIRRGRLRLKWRWIFIGAILFAGLTFLYLGTSPWDNILNSYGHRKFDLIERLMTQSRVLWHYLSLLYVPLADRFVFLYDFPLSRGLLSPVTTLLGILSWMGVIAVTWICRKRWPLFCWMAAWFLIAHLIESTVIPLEIIFEHRMYLPSIGLSLGTLLLSYDFLCQRVNRPKIQATLLAMAILVLGSATYTRNLDYTDEITLYSKDVLKYPASRRVRLYLALALNSDGQYGRGGRLLKGLAREYPRDLLIQQNWLAFMANLSNDYHGIEPIYKHIVETIEQGYYERFRDGTALWNLACSYHKIGHYEKALFLVDFLLKDGPSNHLLFLKGRCYAALGQWSSAIQAFHQAYEINPRDPPTLYWYGKCLVRTGDHDRGCRMLDEAAHNPIDVDATHMSRQLYLKRCQETSGES